MRLFLAIDCNSRKEAFKKLQRAMPEENTMFPNSFHLTLKFLGETSREDFAKLRQQLLKLSFAQFQLEFDHLGFFSHHKSRRIIWAGISRKNKVKALQQEIDTLLAPVRKPQKKFLPHVTLARMRTNTKAPKHLQAVVKPMMPLLVDVRKIEVIQSTLTPTGPVYKTVLEINALDA